MDYKDRLLKEYRELVIKGTKLEQSEFFQHDALMQEQAEAMFKYEQVLRKRILKIMHESDCDNMKGARL